MIRFGADLRPVAEPLDGPFCAAGRGGARTRGWRWWRALRARRGRPGAQHGGAFSTAGELVASYRKLHLFDAFGQRESDLVAPGDEVVVATLAGPRSGLQICYDIRFPELTRALRGRRRAAGHGAAPPGARACSRRSTG